MKKILIALLVGALVCGVGAVAYLRSFSEARADPAFFEREIRAYEAADRGAMPEPGAIVFVGSSSIRLWTTLAEDMAPLRVLNRGFGGAHFVHVLHNADRVVIPYAPKAVVLYVGDNDIAAGTSVEDVVSRYRAFVDQIRANGPETAIYFLPIKPSKLRWEWWPEMARANAEIASIAAEDPRLHVIDVATVLLDAKGEPRDDVFVFDGLHLNATGYAEWTRVVHPVLLSDYGP